MAAPLLVPIAYGLVRGLISRYGSKQGVRMLMRELKVNQNTASKILDTYKKVDKKGSITQKLGGKDVISNKNTMNIQLSSKAGKEAKLIKDAPKNLNRATGSASATGGRLNTGNFPAMGGVNPTGAGGRIMPPEGQGFLATSRDVLTSPTALTLGAAGTAYSLFGDEEETGLNQEPMANLPITKQSYNKFKDEFAAYQNSKDSYNTGSFLFDEQLSSLTGNENDPRNNPENKEEYELYKRQFGYAGTRGTDIQDTPQGVQLAIDNLVDENKLTTAQINKQNQDLKAAQRNIADIATLTSEEPPQNRFGDRFTRIEGEDRGLFGRTLNLGTEPVYQENIYDSVSRRYVPNKDGRKFTESQLLNNSMNVTVPTNTGETFTATETIRPLDTRTQMADGTIRATDTMAKNAPASGNADDIARLMGLVNYLGANTQPRNQFMGNTGNFNMGIFNNQTPMQQYYGTRPVGFLDPEFYKNIGGFFQ